MKKRCDNPSSKSYKYYGGQGVTVCNEWKDYTAFKEWALKNGYDEDAPKWKCTIDRINPFGNYEPSNCRWIPMSEQSKNKRKNYKRGENDEQ